MQRRFYYKNQRQETPVNTRQTLRAKMDRDIRSLNKRRVILFLVMFVMIANYLIRLYTVDFHPTGGIGVWLAHAFVATITPLVAGMLIEQNMRQRRIEKENRQSGN